MGSCSCTRRHFLLSICFLQVITIIERQVFDFLGYMWAPILVNFFDILFIIFGFYGAYHFRVKYIITYLIWNFLWIGWNAFLICFYLNVGQLDRNSDLLNLGTGSVSWFEANGYGCKPTYSMTADDPLQPQRPEHVEGCLLDYPLVEITHSGVQCALALLGILGAILISCIFLDEDDRFDFMNGDAKSPQHTVVHPMYVSYTSIPTTSASATMQSNKHLQLQQPQQNSLKLYHHQQQQQPKLHHFNKNNQLSGSNNNTLNNNLHQRAPSLLLPTNTTNNHSASFQPHNHNLNHSHQPSTNHLTHDGSNCSSLRRHRHGHGHQHSKTPVSPCPMSPQTTPSLSYASLQNSNPYLAGNSLSNSNYSIFQSPDSLQGSSHFARIHHKPKPPKSGVPASGAAVDLALTSPVRPLERLSRSLEEDEEDIFSLQQFAPGEHGVTYVPFQSPTPNSLFLGDNNNVFQANSRSSPNNNAYPYDHNGLPSPPIRLARRPTHIPLPTVPMHSCLDMQFDEEADADGESELDHDHDQMLTPPPPPVVARPQIHQRLGQAPYLDLSPEVVERYAMPSKLGQPGPPLPHPLPVPHGSPMVRRSNRRPRPPIPVNFCDQIRAPPPGYVVRAQSDDRLVEQHQQQLAEAEAAPHVNRRSGRSANGQKSRPRSFCNSIVGVQA
ncbi:sodium/potassium-transporting ATPase subunit beta-1-interacting protein isoform X1 [Drosophila gunungcola]|uniref:sodium/potassium-transporting ATPase subunit beta-1-interacting protein isoform X1 n=1 Tax=Drosophila gunungcola TaxID=103775 RepID=UPI0022E85B81|nr:sodium/potassium-transporting ATPase subunit beta-1-interacting protein isoform X1 [Drosophila gunungcola]XP_052838879.1 sodium/potassium-transporting ATPase subunit beta-1-interacting protein isoform X1 [Drosophila gunungcola]